LNTPDTKVVDIQRPPSRQEIRGLLEIVAGGDHQLKE